MNLNAFWQKNQSLEYMVTMDRFMRNNFIAIYWSIFPSFLPFIREKCVYVLCARSIQNITCILHTYVTMYIFESQKHDSLAINNTLSSCMSTKYTSFMVNDATFCWLCTSQIMFRILFVRYHKDLSFKFFRARFLYITKIAKSLAFSWKFKMPWNSLFYASIHFLHEANRRQSVERNVLMWYFCHI